MRLQQIILLASLPVALTFSPSDARSASRRTKGSKSSSTLQYIKSEDPALLNPPLQFEQDLGDTCFAHDCAPSRKRRKQSNSINHPYGASHRHSASDWLHNLRTWKNSSVLREIKNPVLCLSAWATFVSVIQKTLIWSGKKNLAMSFCIPHAAHSFLVSSLGLLLVFRTNSAYQRFLEGRKIWEQILTVSRNLSRMTTLYRNEVGSDRRKRIQNLLAAFPYLLRHHVRSGCLCKKDPSQIARQNLLSLAEPTRPEKQCWVDRTDLPWSLIESAQHHAQEQALLKVGQSTNRPLWVCDRMGQEIMGIPMNERFTSRERLKLLGDIDKLANFVGSCERIHQTAVPLHYARHALRSLTVWIMTLPFSLVKDFGLLTGPVTAIVAWLLFGVYQIGHSIEDPFQGSLRLSAMCDDIRRDVLACDDARKSAFYYEDQDVIPSTPEMEMKLPELDLDIFPKSVQSNGLDKVVANYPKLVLADGNFEVIGLKKP